MIPCLLRLVENPFALSRKSNFFQHQQEISMTLLRVHCHTGGPVLASFGRPSARGNLFIKEYRVKENFPTVKSIPSPPVATHTALHRYQHT